MFRTLKNAKPKRKLTVLALCLVRDRIYVISGGDGIQRAQLLRPPREQGRGVRAPRRRRLHARVQEVRGGAAPQGRPHEVREHPHEDGSHRIMKAIFRIMCTTTTYYVHNKERII